MSNRWQDSLPFLKRLGSDADVDLEPGYNQDEIFDDQLSRRASEIQRGPGQQGAIAVIPSKQGPWTGNNQLGIEREFAPDANNRQTILRLDEWGFPESWSLVLGMNEFAIGAGSGFDVTALVEFGAGGVTQYVEVDWVNGSGIVLPMNALNLVAQYNLIDGEIPGTIPDDLRLRASICRGPSPNLRPTRSYWLLTGSDSFVIPPFAKAMHVMQGGGSNIPFDFYSQQVAVAFSTAPTAGVLVAQYMMSNFVESIDFANEYVSGIAWVPIPPYARVGQFRTIPAGAPSTQQCLIQFLIGV